MKKIINHVKKFSALFLFVALVASFSICGFAINYIYGRVNANNVNLRTSTYMYAGNNVLGLVHLNDGVAVSDYQLGADNTLIWDYCDMTSGQNAGKSGWIAENYITFN